MLDLHLLEKASLLMLLLFFLLFQVFAFTRSWHVTVLVTACGI